MVGNNCVFQDSWIEKYPFLSRGSGNSVAHCSKCRVEFSVKGQGIHQVEQHANTNKHKKNTLAAAMSSKLTVHFTKKVMGETEKLLAAREATFAYHTVKHRQSYRSMDCTSGLVRTFYEKTFTCARTKCEAIISKVIYPHVKDQLKIDLQKCNFVTVAFDASNQREIKLMPILVRYFNVESGICVKVVELKSLPGETADEVTAYLKTTAEQHGIKTKIIGISADNTNTNFGGSKRRGQMNVFRLMEKELGTELFGIGCSSHIVHNGIKAAADLLPIDIEIIIGKLFHYFKNYTVRTERLKEFCEFCEVEYQRVKGYTSTRWLALLPAIERLLVMFEPLKSFFLPCEKPPVTLVNFFNDPTAELWLYFLQNQANLFQSTIQKIQGERVTISGVSKVLNTLKGQLKSRCEDCFLPAIFKTQLQKLESQGDVQRRDVLKFVTEFYKTAYDYLMEWTSHFSDFSEHGWIDLTQEIPSWTILEEGMTKVLTKINSIVTQKVDDSKLYDQLAEARIFVTEAKLLMWDQNGDDTGKRWMEVFQFFKLSSSSYGELQNVVEFLLCLPGSNASAERVFSRIFAMWTDDKSQLTIDALRAMVTVDYNLDMSCIEFHDYVSNKKTILQDVHSSQKYLG